MKKVVHGIITIMKRKFQLYSDGQQFHHNQQIKQPPLTSNHLTLKKNHNIWYWKFRSWLGKDTKLWQG
jgi:FtsZ-binding cell division protein ZapB